MLISTATFIRETTATPFFTVDDQFRDVYQTRYAELGKCNTQTILSADGLTLSVIGFWTAKAYFDEFIIDADAITMKETRLLYCISNNITLDYHGELANDENDPIPHT
jgi:hypothetical protein